MSTDKSLIVMKGKLIRSVEEKLIRSVEELVKRLSSKRFRKYYMEHRRDTFAVDEINKLQPNNEWIKNE